MKRLISGLTLIIAFISSLAIAQTPIPALINITVLASGVTTNTTSVAKPLPGKTITFKGQVVCSSGACTQTQAVYGDDDNDSANGVLLCTITLTATTRDDDACGPMTGIFNYYYVTTTNTTGTNATGAVYAMFE